MKIVSIYETAKDTDSRLTPLEPAARKTARNILCAVTVDEMRTFQKIEGFGGALTESSGYVLGKLSAEDRTKVIEAFFNPETGNAWTIARTHINSCDFSLGNWACVEKKDETLESFSTAMAERYQIPLLEDAFRASRGGLKFMLSPWSPPAWMKDNNEMNRGGKLLRNYYPLWAKYFVRFIDELKKRGLPVWAVSVQNEPEAQQPWDSCLWTGTEEAEFAVNDLGPELERAGYGSVKILVWDHNRDRLWARMTESMSVPGAEKYIGGAAFHWYSGDDYHNVAKVAAAYPDKLLVFTEGCVEGGSRPGAWFSGERYAHNVINDLNSGCQAWIDWNVALDMEGGPNHVGNFCDAPVLIDTENGAFQFQSSYWYLGHFSRFIKPGAVRIATRIDAGMIPAAIDGRMGNTVETCAFRNPDGSIALVLCNRTEADMIYRLDGILPEGIGAWRCPPRGIQTIIIR